jgi:hypothetical protein
VTFDKENVRDLSTPTSVTTRHGEDVAIGTTYIPKHMLVSCWRARNCGLGAVER